LRELTLTLAALLLAMTFSCSSGGGGTEKEEDIKVTPDLAVTPDLKIEEVAPLDLPPVETTNTDGMTLEEWEKLYGEPCDLADRIGRIEITVSQYGSWLDGKLFDKPSAQQVLTPKESEGECILMMAENFHCDPACMPGEECTKDGTCEVAQAPQGAGTLTATGLSEEVVIEPNTGKYYSKVDFAEDAFETGALIEVTAPGDELEGFALQGAGVDKLELVGGDWSMTPGEPLDIEWIASDGPGNVLIRINVDQHGVTPVWLRCEVEDTGSYTIPASMTEGLINYGVSGAATTDISRRTVDSADVKGGCIELEVYSSQKGQLQVK